MVILTGLGLPVPEDAVVLAGGYLVHRGVTALVPTMVVVLAGVLVGDVALYLIGRGWGRRVVGHRWVARLASPERLARAQRFFDRWGGGAVFVARFVMGLRAAVFLTAGTLRMGFARFFLVNLAAALVSVPLLVWVGWWFGAQIDRVAEVVLRVKLVALVVVVAAAVAVLLARWLLRRRKTPP